MITTKGWDVKVFWKDKSTNWILRDEIKDSNPIEVVEDAIVFKHDRKPAFNWWVRKVINERDRIIGQLHAAICRKGKMKFGIDILGTMKDVVSLDEANGNTICRNSIKLEMNNSLVSFKLCNKLDKSPVGNTEITCHLIFDLKIDMT